MFLAFFLLLLFPSKTYRILYVLHLGISHTKGQKLTMYLWFHSSARLVPHKGLFAKIAAGVTIKHENQAFEKRISFRENDHFCYEKTTPVPFQNCDYKQCNFMCSFAQFSYFVHSAIVHVTTFSLKMFYFSKISVQL